MIQARTAGDAGLCLHVAGLCVFVRVCACARVCYEPVQQWALNLCLRVAGLCGCVCYGSVK